MLSHITENSGQKATESVLDEIKGLSSTSKETLMKEFKDVKKISKASYEELCEKSPNAAPKPFTTFSIQMCR